MARAWPLRITLFVATNLAVMLIFGAVVSLLGLDRALGTSPAALLGMAGIFGFGGSLVSLALSKRSALMSTGAHIITHPESPYEEWVLEVVEDLAGAAGIGTPDVAVYDSPIPNAFATGMWRNSALVAVSTGLVEAMEPEEVQAVLAHELAHVANGDMITLSLLQGVVNTFVIAAARIVGSVVDRTVFGNERGYGAGYFITSMIAQAMFGVLASVIVMWFSRRREFRADAGAADLVGAPSMISALRRLMHASEIPSDLPREMAAFGIQGGALAGLFRTHPPLEDRIAALQRR